MITAEQTGSPEADCWSAWCRWDPVDHRVSGRVLLMCWADGKGCVPSARGMGHPGVGPSEAPSWTSLRQGLEGDLCPWRCSDVTGGLGSHRAGVKPPFSRVPFQPPSPTIPSGSTAPHLWAQQGTHSLAPASLAPSPASLCRPALPTGLPEPAAPQTRRPPPCLRRLGRQLSVRCFSSLP